MSSKKEEERNEKIIRGLMKLPPNRRCINCNSLGPQYVCTNFWTFVCIACSGIHREFTHRVKSVSMAKFTTQEVEALQRGGNQRARETFLKDWDTQQMRLPDNSNPDKIREFIKNVYVDKKYAGSRSSDKPPRDTQKEGEDHRRASSYHSFSQSPPYDHQYEERRYGRQAGMLTRKPGSDRGHYEGKLGSFIYSPGHQAEQTYEDRFANESSGSRMSDYSISSDPFRSDGQSPNFHDTGFVSPPSQVSGILVEDTRYQKLGTSSESNVKEDINRIPQAHRSVSSGSFGSFDSNSISVKLANSGSLIDSVLAAEHASGIQQAGTSTIPSLPQIPSVANTTKIDLFSQEFVQSQNTFTTPSIDLLADINNQPPKVSSSEQKPPAVPSSENEGWAIFDLPRHAEPPFKASTGLPPIVPPGEKDASMGNIDLYSTMHGSSSEGWAIFDLPHHAEPPFKANTGLPPIVLPGEKDAPKGNIDLLSTMHSSSDWFSVQNPASQGHSSLATDQWPMGLNEVKQSADSRNSQFWNVFHDSSRNIPQTSSGILHQNSESLDVLHRPLTSVDPYAGFRAPEVMFNDLFLSSALDDKTPAVAPVTGMAGSSFPLAAIPPMGGTTQERKAANPFDLPYDLDTEASNVFLEMSSLQAALPDPQLPANFLGSLPEPWFPQNSLPSLVPPGTQGGLAYIGGQVPSAQLQNIPSQGPVAPLGGNPFAYRSSY